MASPDDLSAPQRVRMALPDGSEIPLRLVRVPDRNGVRRWVGYGPAGVEVPPGSSVRMDVLPEGCGVEVPVVGGPGGGYYFAEGAAADPGL